MVSPLEVCVIRNKSWLRLGLVLWLCWSPAWAQLPATSEVALSGKMGVEGSDLSSTYARLEKYPLFRIGVEYLEAETGLNLKTDLIQWVGDEIHLAVVRVGPESPFYLLWRDYQIREAYDGAVRDLYDLGREIDLFREENEGRLPDSVAEVEEQISYPLSRPQGVDYLYTVTPAGEFTLKAVFEEGALVAQGGPPPEFRDGLVEPSAAILASQPIQFLVMLELRQPSRARQHFEALAVRLFGESGMEPLSVSVIDQYLVFSDSPKVLARVEETLKGKRQSLETTPLYKSVAKQFASRPDSILLVDIASVLKHWPAPVPAQLDQIVSALPWFGGASHYYGDHVVTELFLAIEPPDGHPLENLLAMSANRSQFPVLNMVPGRVSNFSVVDGRSLYEMIEVGAQIEPTVGALTSLGLAKIEEVVGFQIEDWVRESSAELLFSWERIDFLALIVNEFRDFEEGFPLPGVAALHLPQDHPGLAQRVQGFLGDSSSYRVSGVEVQRSGDLDFAYAKPGNYALLSGVGTYRLLDDMLLTHGGARLAITGLDSYTRFQNGVNGRQVALSYQKVDWIYSLVKGVGLLLGAEFRADMTELGRFRDLYSDLVLEAGGLRIRTGIYASEQAL